MTMLLRHAMSYATPGNGEKLAALLADVAAGLANHPGCEQYIVSRVSGDPDAVVVSERWRSAEDMHAALETVKDSPQFAEVVGLIDRARAAAPLDLMPVGGIGLIDSPAAGYEHRAVLDLEDVAPKFGLGAMGACRPVGRELAMTQLGAQHYVIPPGIRQLFGHRHANAEELYVVIAGSGNAALDDEIRPLQAGDVLRVGPEVLRAFEAGGDGMTLLAVGATHAGDGELEHGWWPAGD